MYGNLAIRRTAYVARTERRRVDWNTAFRRLGPNRKSTQSAQALENQRTNYCRGAMNPTLAVYEPPLSPEFAATYDFWGCGDRPLAPGVKGLAYEKDGLIMIPLITAECEGSGDVGRMLDRLSSRCRIVTVTSTRLAGMLVRRGWKKHDSLEFGDMWER